MTTTWRNRPWILAVFLALVAVPQSATAESGAKSRELRAGLLHIRQTGPTSDYRVYGAPGAGPQYAEISAVYSDGSSAVLGFSVEDGSFAYSIEHAKAEGGVWLKSRIPGSSFSEPVALPLGHPRQGGMSGPPNERGFVNIAPADADIQEGLDRWLEAVRSLSQPGGAPINMERLGCGTLEALDAQTDVVVYGYTPVGDSVTCIIGPSGYSITAAATNGVFQIRVPHGRLQVASRYRWAPPAFVINVTTAANQIVASTGHNSLPTD